MPSRIDVNVLVALSLAISIESILKHSVGRVKKKKAQSEFNLTALVNDGRGLRPCRFPPTPLRTADATGRMKEKQTADLLSYREVGDCIRGILMGRSCPPLPSPASLYWLTSKTVHGRLNEPKSEKWISTAIHVELPLTRFVCTDSVMTARHVGTHWARLLGSKRSRRLSSFL